MKIITPNKHTFNLIAIPVLVLAFVIYLFIADKAQGQTFDGEEAYEYVLYQTSLGPRTVGSEAHEVVLQWLQEELTKNKWGVSVQEANRLGIRVQNVIAKRGEGRPWIVLGAHYDSRSLADRDLDPIRSLEPVPGANDGASGVAVLLELSRVLAKRLEITVWLVFFDAEDNGNIAGQDWILGSRVFVDSLEEKPDSVVIVDMIGDKDLNLYWERNSNAALTKEIWNIAIDSGFSNVFIPQYKHKIIDDHIPFLQAGIPAVDIIDFDYPYWHTAGDTADKVSSESLSAVGNTLLRWLEIVESR